MRKVLALVVGLLGLRQPGLHHLVEQLAELHTRPAMLAEEPHGVPLLVGGPAELLSPLHDRLSKTGGSRGVGPRDAGQAPVPSSHALRGGGKHAASEQNVTAQALRVPSGGSTRTRERRHATPPAVHAAKPRYQYWCPPHRSRTISGCRRRRGSPAPRARRCWATVSPAAQPGEKT